MEKIFAGKPKSARVSARYFGTRKVEKTFFQRDLLKKIINFVFLALKNLSKKFDII